MNDHRLLLTQAPTYQRLQHHAARTSDQGRDDFEHNVAVECGWGKILMGHTFQDPKFLAEQMCKEGPGKRDIALYVTDPHIVLAHAPQQLFLDPSDTFRLDLSLYRTDQQDVQPNVLVRRVQTLAEAKAVSHIYLSRQMVAPAPEFIFQNRLSKSLIYLVAEDTASGQVVGTVMGLNHIELFNDPSAGASLWCLAVDPQAPRPRVGVALVNYLAKYFQTRRCAYMDLSVMHDNEQARNLYEQMGFKRLRTFAIKNKNAFNEDLFLGPNVQEKMNPYAEIIINEARARGISVEILDAAGGYFRLSRGGKQIVCRESLSELTSAVAVSLCQDKLLTHRWLEKINIKTPAYQLAADAAQNQAFLQEHGTVVVKPTTGEQGKGITIGVKTPAQLNDAILLAQQYGEQVLLESFHQGEDLRVVVIKNEVVAAAVRRPAQIVGDGVSSVRKLIEKQSRRRASATKGESKIPLDKVTEQCITEQGYDFESVLASGEKLTVRKTANLHTGGTIHDVTEQLHPEIGRVAVAAAKHLNIPVVGFDFLVQAVDQPEYVFIEANERVGLANHEPQPTAQKFLDLLFPLSVSAKYSPRSE